MIKSVIAPVELNPKIPEAVDKEDAVLNARVYASTNILLIALIFQIFAVLASALPVIYGLYQFLRFQYIADGFYLKFGPVVAMSLSLSFALLASVWQFASILSFRSLPSALTHSKYGFLPVIIVGGLLSFQYISIAVVLLTLNSNWEVPIRNNFDLLIEAAVTEPFAAQELNQLQTCFDCCGSSTNASESTLRSKYASFQPFFNTFFPHDLKPSLLNAKNLPYSCCKRASPSLQCYHLDLESAVDYTRGKPFQTYPSSNLTHNEAMKTLNVNSSCPEAIFEAVKWQLFIYPGILFVIVGIVCLCISILGGWSLWSLHHSRKSAESIENQTTVVQESDEKPEVPVVAAVSGEAVPKSADTPNTL